MILPPPVPLRVLSEEIPPPAPLAALQHCSPAALICGRGLAAVWCLHEHDYYQAGRCSRLSNKVGRGWRAVGSWGGGLACFV